MKNTLKRFVALCVLLICIINVTGCAVLGLNNTTSYPITKPENSHHNRVAHRSNLASFNKKIIAIGAGTIVVISIATLIVANIALHSLAHGIAANNAHGA